MQIGIDGRALEVGGGVRNYTINLVRWLPVVDKKNEYFLFTTDRFADIEGIQPIVLKSVNGRLPNSLFEVLAWEQFRLPQALRKHGIDLLHSPKHVGPLGASCKLVVTVWDSAYFDHPEFYGSLEAFYWRVMSRLTALKADRIIVPSISARNDLIGCGFPAQKMQTVPIAVGSEFQPVRSTEAIRQVLYKHTISSERGYLLFVGDIEPKKNIEVLLKAYAIIKKADYDQEMVIVGKARTHYLRRMTRLSHRLGIDKYVKFIGFVNQADLAPLYSGADIFLFPSRYEGFGLPPLEAISCGTPAIVSNAGSIPEVIDDGGLSVNSDNAEAWAKRIMMILSNAALREELGRQALERAMCFSWERTASMTANTYATLRQ